MLCVGLPFILRKANRQTENCESSLSLLLILAMHLQLHPRIPADEPNEPCYSERFGIR